MAVFHHGALFGGMHAQNGGLRRIDDWGGHHRAECAAVGDGEGTAGQIFNGDFAVFGFHGVIHNRSFDFGNAHLVGIAQDGHNQAAWRTDGDTDVEIAVVHNVFTVYRSVHNGEFFQRSHRRFHEERHKAQLHAVFFFKFFFVFCAQIHYRFHIDFVKRGQNGVFLLRSQQAFGNAGTQAAHRYALFGARAGRCGRGRSSLHFGGGIFHVFFQYAAVAARTLNGSNVHAGFCSQFRSGRQGNAGLCVGAWRCFGGRCGSRSWLCGRRGGSGSGFGIDFGQELFGSNGFAVLHHDFNQYAGLRRRHFQNDFIGFNIDQCLVAGHGIAHFFMPRQQRSFGNTFCKNRYFYFNNHNGLQ